jgi:DNA-binding NarL/FixJ family response regulator
MTYSRKIIIVDDHEMIVQGLKSYLSARLNNFKILSANSISELFEVIETNSIDVFLLDLMIGEDDSRLYIKKIKEANKSAKILIISSYESTDIMNSVFDVGADGFIGKSNSSQYIVDGINSVLNDQKYLDPNSENKFEKEKTSLASESEQIQLTKREKEVLFEILNEKSTKEIASVLHLTPKTIEFHRSSLLTKFNVKNVSGLVRKAMLNGYDLERRD